MSKTGNLIWGWLAVCAGVCWAVLIQRGLILVLLVRKTSIDPWQIASLILSLPIAASLVWIGVRALQRASGRQLSAPRVRWGRLSVGCILLLVAAKAQFTPNEGPYFPANEAQAMGMRAVPVLIELGALAMIVTALRRKETALTPAPAPDAAAQ
jgi:hypothetical protein